MAEKISESNLKFILNEIPKLLELNLINQETSDKLNSYYSTQINNKKNGKNKVLTLILISIGALLVGLGCCLIISHNWNKFNTVTRLLMAFVPLTLNSIFLLYAFNKGEVARESASIIQSAAIAASIAIVAQVYNLGGTLFNFLQIWMILYIPFVLLLRSKLGVLILSGIYFIYLINGEIGGIQKQTLISGILYFIPFSLLLYNIIAGKIKNLMIIFQLTAVALVIQYLVIFAPDADELTLPLTITVISGFFVLGCELNKREKFFNNIFMVSGYLALLITLIILSNPDTDFYFSKFFWEKIDINHIPWMILAFASLVYNIYYAFRRRNGFYFAPLIMVVISAICASFPYTEIWVKFALLIVGFTVGVYGIFEGCRVKSMLGLNAAVIMIVALIFNYFFSSDLSIIARGIAFIFTGIGFVVLNLIVNRKFKKSLSEG